MDLSRIANSKNDEWYTPVHAVQPIVKYLKQKEFRTIWCPFDTEHSNYFKVFKEHDFNVIATHIGTGQDFFTYPIPDCDVIVSNPPYSCKGKVFEHLFKIGKPFAMLVGVVGLFESQHRFEMFKNNPFEILYLNKRISFLKSYDEVIPSMNPPFSSVYLTSRILPQQICFDYVYKK